jgi:hypothetical protein
MASKKSASSSRHIRLEVLSVLRSTETGVRGAVVWVAAGEFDDADRHLGPRLLIVQGDSIRKERLANAGRVRLTSRPDVVGVLPPELARQIVMFAGKNRRVLVRHWYGEIDTQETLDLLERLP